MTDCIFSNVFWKVLQQMAKYIMHLAKKVANRMLSKKYQLSQMKR